MHLALTETQYGLLFLTGSTILAADAILQRRRLAFARAISATVDLMLDRFWRPQVLEAIVTAQAFTTETPEQRLERARDLLFVALSRVKPVDPEWDRRIAEAVARDLWDFVPKSLCFKGRG